MLFTRRTRAMVLAVLVGISVLVAVPAQAVPTTPMIVGAPVVGQTLTVDAPDPGETYKWFLGDTEVYTGPAYPLAARDLGGAVSVSADGGPRSLPLIVGPGTIAAQSGPTIGGDPAYKKTLTRSIGVWYTPGLSFRTQWLRNGQHIPGATGATYTVSPYDVGAQISVRVRADALGYTSFALDATPVVGRQARPVKRVVTYRVATRGKITADVATFRTLAHQTLNDPRGWRSMGIEFREVKKGGSFTLWLSAAGRVPSFSGACSSTWSCRVGRNVVINQTRWQNASPMWKRNKGSLRSYRDMVVNHEVGHWLGRGHARCGGKGKLAPLMQQQSKGLNGCRMNPWPKAGELKAPRFPRLRG